MGTKETLFGFREVQMASKFGEYGRSYYTKHGGVSKDCRWDPDCVANMTSASVDSCTESDVCTPKMSAGYAGSGLPGRVWGEPVGFKAKTEGDRVDIFYEGSTTTLACLGEREVTVEHDGDEHTLKYLEFALGSLQRR